MSNKVLYKIIDLKRVMRNLRAWIQIRMEQIKFYDLMHKGAPQAFSSVNKRYVMEAIVDARTKTEQLKQLNVILRFYKAALKQLIAEQKPSSSAKIIPIQNSARINSTPTSFTAPNLKPQSKKKKFFTKNTFNIVFSVLRADLALLCQSTRQYNNSHAKNNKLNVGTNNVEQINSANQSLFTIKRFNKNKHRKPQIIQNYNHLKTNLIK